MKVKDLCYDWLEVYRGSDVKPQTYLRYKCIIDNQITGEWGSCDIEDVTPHDVLMFINEIKTGTSARTGRPLSAASVNMTITLIKMVFRYAVDFGYLESNPCDKLKNASGNRPKGVKCFTVAEQSAIEDFIEQMEDDSLKCVLFDLYTGLRIGELLALEWSDVDLENGLIHVRRTTYTIPGPDGTWINCVGEPKSACSLRDIPLTDDMYDLLSGLKQRSLGRNVFEMSDGRAISPRLCRWRYKKMLEELNIPYKSFHTLRHTFATRAMESGMDVKTLSEILGHSNAAITLNIYTHSMMDHKRAMMNNMPRIGKKT